MHDPKRSARPARGLFAVLVAVSVAAMTLLAADAWQLRRYHAVTDAQALKDGLRQWVAIEQTRHPRTAIETDAEGRVTRIIVPHGIDRIAATRLDRAAWAAGLAFILYEPGQAGLPPRPVIVAAGDVEIGGSTAEHAASTEGMAPGGGPLAVDPLDFGPVEGGPAMTVTQADPPLLARRVPIVDSAEGVTIGAIAVATPRSTPAGGARSAHLITLLCLASLFAALWGILARLQRPGRRLATTLAALAAGDLDAAAPSPNAAHARDALHGPLETIRTALRTAQTATQTRSQAEADQTIVIGALARGLTVLSQRDLTAEIEHSEGRPFPQSHETLREGFNRLVAALSETIAELREMSDEVRGGALEMRTVADELSQRTETQAATLAQSAAAIDTLSENVRVAADHAQTAEGAVAESQEAARSAGTVVHQAIEAMGRIETSSHQITQIIAVIDDIAFQTNLLALNAGVEAARAGEAGRGFAVVASEVRSLAQRTSASAKEIKELIAASQDEVQAGSGLVTKAGDALRGIVDRVEAVSGLITDIAGSAREQSTGLAEVNTGMGDLDAVTQHNAAMAEEVSASAETLRDTAERLSGLVAVYRVAGSGKRAGGEGFAGKGVGGPLPGGAADAWAQDLTPEHGPSLAGTAIGGMADSGRARRTATAPQPAREPPAPADLPVDIPTDGPPQPAGSKTPAGMEAAQPIKAVPPAIGDRPQVIPRSTLRVTPKDTPKPSRADGTTDGNTDGNTARPADPAQSQAPKRNAARKPSKAGGADTGTPKLRPISSNATRQSASETVSDTSGPAASRPARSSAQTPPARAPLPPPPDDDLDDLRAWADF